MQEIITLDVFNEKGLFLGTKNFYSSQKESINKWIIHFNKKNLNIIAYLGTGAPDFQNQKYLCLLNNKGTRNVPYVGISKENFIVICIYFAVRHCIPHTWLNDRDQFLYPNDKWQKDNTFQNDCLAFTLFHSQNRISAKEGINHLIPFSEKELGAQEAFQSDFLYQFLQGKIKTNPQNKLFNDEELLNFIPKKALIFSEEAKWLFKAGLELFRYYHQVASDEQSEQSLLNPHLPYNVNASLLDIKEFFQGRSTSGKLNGPKQAKDEHYKLLLGNLNSKLLNLAKKIEPKIYEYGFLKE